MGLTVRPYEDRDSDGYWHVRDMTYNDGQPTPAEKRVIRTTRAFVAEHNGHIAGVFNVLGLTCTRGPATLKCAGIAGVAVLPEYRHLGIGSDMMRWSIPFLKSEGYEIASLYGFRESFYRKFGYEACGLRLKIHCPSHRLPRLKPELPIGKLANKDFHKLTECHTAFARMYSGMNIRTDYHWGRVLNDAKTIYTAGDPIGAYAILEHKIDFWEPQWVNEIAWSSAAGYRSIMSLLGQICINKSALEWWEPYPSPFLSMYQDAGVKAAMDRTIMYRILDVEACLSQAEFDNDYRVAIQDPLIPTNESIWYLKGEKATEAQESLTIGEFTQAFLGEAPLGSGLGAVLPQISPYCIEFF
jgi:predicted acetyltransferase